MNQTFLDRIFYASIVIATTLVFGIVWLVREEIKAPAPEAPPIVEKTVVFEDVAPDHPASEAIYDLSRQGILQGYADRTFRPDEQANRAESIKILLQINPFERGDVFEQYARYQEEEKLEPKGYFIYPDITPDSWFAPYLLKAVRLGLVSGNPNGNFEAGRPIMLSEFLKMLFVLEREQIAKDDEKEQPFDSVEPFMWYTSYFVRAKDIGLLPLAEGELVNPSEQLTRGRIAQIIHRYFQLRTSL